MSTPKKEAAKENTNMEQVQAALQALIAQGKKDGMIRLSDLNAQLEKLRILEMFVIGYTSWFFGTLRHFHHYNEILPKSKLYIFPKTGETCL